jgi:signal transduction histidine kinase
MPRADGGRRTPAPGQEKVSILTGPPGPTTSLLLSVIEAVSSGPDVNSLAAAVAQLITDATATDVCFVHVLDDEECSLTLAGATPPFDVAVGQVRLEVGTGVSGWVAAHRQPAVIVEHKEKDSRYVPVPLLRGRDFVSMASVPMASEAAGLVGVLNVHTAARREFTTHDVRLLTVIGSLVAGSMHAARMHRHLAQREQAQERFTEQVIAAQESERRRLAREIHDGISQRLVSLSYHLDAARRSLTERPSEAAAQLRLARELAELSMDEARIAISGLRPPVLDDLGLAGGLRSLARSLPDLAVHLDLAEHRLAENLELALYRIAQEALQNVVKHAEATQAWVSFAVHAEVAHLEIRDDGVGPGDSVRAGGYGMHSMAERAELVGGQVTVRARPEGGTAVVARLPLDAPGDHPGRSST